MATDFAARFRQITARGDGQGAHDPFPWQVRLYDRLVAGDLPGALDLPTGLGKTSVMAIWLLARAAGADLPRRLIYVVDRRAVVDQASTEAERLRDNAESLGWPQAWRPKISTLRGAHIDNRDWLADPAGAAIVVGTVDMIGSRLLFQGYGVSPGMRPYHAAMLGTDSLIVLDEAHLVPPFLFMLDAVATEAAMHGRERPPIRGMALMTLSATLRPGSAAGFGLCDQDRAHPIIAQRLDAPKALEWRAAKPLPDAMVKAARDLVQHQPSARIVIFCDRREIAEKAHSALGKANLGDVALFVGARRMHERSLAAAELKDLGFLADTRPPRSRPAFLVATSAAEVGVDLDADHMICDVVAWERMVQRLGRVNRRGGRAARVILCDLADDPARDAEADPAPTQAPEQASDTPGGGAADPQLSAVRTLLRMLADASPAGLRSLAQTHAKLVAQASTPAPLRPALTRAVVESWALTSIKHHSGRPKVGPWLRGWVDDDAQTRVVWRTHLPVRNEPPVRLTQVKRFFKAAPIHLSEVLETETRRVAAWARDAAGRLPGPRDRTIAWLLAPDNTPRRSLTVDDLAVLGDKDPDLPGATLVVDARLGGLRAGLLDPACTDPVPTADGGVVDPRQFGWHARSTDPEADREPEADDEIELEQDRVIGSEPDADTGPGAVATRTDWPADTGFRIVKCRANQSSPGVVVDEFLLGYAETDAPRLVIIQTKARPRDARGVWQSLDDHTNAVVVAVERIAAALELDPNWRRLLALAARLHDQGKADPHWQAANGAPLATCARPIAKSPRLLGHLGGYAHAFGSLIHAIRDAGVQGLATADRDLVLHLIAAHHGDARPWISAVVGGPDAGAIARDAALRYARLQDRWGPWGLAWWEMLLRAADQTASRAAQPGRSDD